MPRGKEDTSSEESYPSDTENEVIMVDHQPDPGKLTPNTTGETNTDAETAPMETQKPGQKEATSQDNTAAPPANKTVEMEEQQEAEQRKEDADSAVKDAMARAKQSTLQTMELATQVQRNSPNPDAKPGTDAVSQTTKTRKHGTCSQRYSKEIQHNWQHSTIDGTRTPPLFPGGPS